MQVCAIEDDYSIHLTAEKNALADYYITDFRQVLDHTYEDLRKLKQFLPISRADMEAQGIKQLDFVYVIGDAYVDHPSFGCAIITRTLQAYGYSCAVLPQPDWHNDDEFTQFRGSRVWGFLVSAGNIDSMVNHYSVNKRRRDKDSYSDEGVMGKRPDRPTIVYTQIVKRLFPHKPVLIGGIEASLRRLSHYDYWDDKVRRSILIDSQADL